MKTYKKINMKVVIFLLVVGCFFNIFSKEKCKKLEISMQHLNACEIVVDVGVVLEAGDGSMLVGRTTLSKDRSKDTISIPQPDKSDRRVHLVIKPSVFLGLLDDRKNVRAEYQRKHNLRSVSQSDIAILHKVLTTEMWLDYDTLPKKLVLTNPLKILQDLFDCYC